MIRQVKFVAIPVSDQQRALEFCNGVGHDQTRNEALSFGWNRLDPCEEVARWDCCSTRTP